MQTLTTEQLITMREKNEDFALINVLPEDAFNKQHIPGSVNISVGDDDFLKKVQQKVDGKDKTVVVYCANTDCDASPTAAKKLDSAGFTKVYDYEAGMKAWREKGLAVESAA